MIIDWPDFQARQAAAFDRVRKGLGERHVELNTAGELAALMARLPVNTPIVVADAARVDPRLQPDATPTRTVIVAEVVPLADPTAVVEINEDGDIRRHPAISPAVQLGAVTFDANTYCPPLITVPLPARERAIEALEYGETALALGSQVELLNWIADTLTMLGEPADDEDSDPDEEDPDQIPNPIEDSALRAELAVEATRLRQEADQLAALRARVAEYEAIIDITDAAEDIVRRAAERPDLDDEL